MQVWLAITLRRRERGSRPLYRACQLVAEDLKTRGLKMSAKTIEALYRQVEKMRAIELALRRSS